MRLPETRYARNGDVHIAYQVVGTGSRDIVLVPSWVSQVEHLWAQPLVSRMLRRLSSFARLIIFDRRGSGLSDRLVGAPALEDQVADVCAVMDAAGSSRAAILAETEGTALAVMFAAAHPERTASLVLFAPIPRIVAAPDYPWAWTAAEREVFMDAAVAGWGTGVTLASIAPSLAHDPDLRDWFARLERLATGPGMVRPMLEALGQTDVRALLPSIRVPTLVARFADDDATHEGHARYVREHIPHARSFELSGAGSLVFAHDLDVLLDELEEFFTGARPGTDSERALATVLFTDIVASTGHAAELGDRRWRELLERHHRVVGDELARFGGRQVKTLGDGVLATFAGPARAVRSAFAMRDASRAIGVEVRAGLHTGEVEQLDGDVAGMAVHIAARVVAEAQPGEILVSRTVTDLVAGSGLTFSDRGSHALKGVPGEWQLFAASP